MDEGAVDEGAADEEAVDEEAEAVDEGAADEGAVDEAAVDGGAADEGAVDEEAETVDEGALVGRGSGLVGLVVPDVSVSLTSLRIFALGRVSGEACGGHFQSTYRGSSS